MNPTFQIIRKDIRMNRWALMLWLVAVIIHFALRCYQLKGGNLPSCETSYRYDHLLLFVLPIMIIPFIMQADAVRKRYAFWKTLPISTSRLLFAKAIVVAAYFILLPMLVEIIYYFIAGLTPVFFNSLLTWAALHIPIICVIYLICFFTPGWKSYFCVAIPLALIAFVCVIGSPSIMHSNYGVNANAQQSPFPAISNPNVLQLKMHQDSGVLEMRYDSKPVPNIPNKYTIESKIYARAAFDINDLDYDEVVHNLIAVGTIVAGDKETPVGLRVARFENGDVDSYSKSDLLPMSEVIRSNNLREEKNASRTLHLCVELENNLPFEYDVIPAEGLKLKGAIRVFYAKKNFIKELPLKTGATWQKGLHSMSVNCPYYGNMRFYPLTSLSLNTITSDFNLENTIPAFPPYNGLHINVEHKKRNIIFRANPITRKVWYDDGKKDISRHKKSYINQLNQLSFPTSYVGELAILRFFEEEDRPDDWQIKLLTYDPVGQYDVPFEITLPKPRNVKKPASNLDEIAAIPVPFETQLNEIRLSSDPSAQEVTDTFQKMVNLLANQDTKVINDHENKIFPLLQTIYDRNSSLLIDALYQEAERVSHLNRYRNNSTIWDDGFSSIKQFWHRVNMVIETSAQEKDKQFIFTHLHPLVSWRVLLERMGWEKEALPYIVTLANTERMPEMWCNFLQKYPSAETFKVLLKQVSLNSRSLARIIQWIDQLEDEKQKQIVATAVWEHVVMRAQSITQIHQEFLIALDHGVDTAPRDFYRMIKNGAMNIEREDDTDSQRALYGLFQGMANHSDCPSTIKEGMEWLLLNGRDLKWNISANKYDVNGLSAAAKVFDDPHWGKLQDTLGLTQVKINSGKLECKTSAYTADYVADFLYRFSPKFVREVSGNFTAQVTVKTDFAASPAWLDSDDNIFQSAGLLLEVTPQHFLRVESCMIDKKQTRGIREWIMRAGSEKYEVRNGNEFDPALPVTLRITRYGDNFYTSWQQGNGEWHHSPAHNCSQWNKNLKISLHSNNRCVKPFTATFSDYRITNESTPPLEYYTPMQNLKAGSINNGENIPQWGNVVNPVNGGSFFVNQNNLTMSVGGHYQDYNYENTMVAPRTSQLIQGDFTQEVTVGTIPHNGWMCQEIYVSSGNDTILRFGPGHSYNRFLEVRLMSLNRAEYTPPFNCNLNFDKPIRLKMRRNGNLVYISVRQENGEWQNMAPLYVNLTNQVEVGVTTLNTSNQSFDAVFSNYSLTNQLEK